MDARYHHIFHIASVLVYLGICIFDFIIVPGWIGLNRDSYQILVPLIAELDPLVAQTIVARPQWDPLTLKGGGLFHIAMGAIITGGVFKGEGKFAGLINKHNNETKL